MVSAVLQIVSTPLPGADMGQIMSNMKEAATLWQRSGGADGDVYTVSVGEIGNMVFTARRDSCKACGKTLDNTGRLAAFEMIRLSLDGARGGGEAVVITHRSDEKQ